MSFSYQSSNFIKPPVCCFATKSILFVFVSGKTPFILTSASALRRSYDVSSSWLFYCIWSWLIKCVSKHRLSLIVFKMLKLLASSIVLLQLACLSYGIHNGLVSNARDFPFFVNLQLAGTNKFCGGTLISDK